MKENIVEDMALGVRLKEAKIPYDLYVADEEISFRMYSGGFRSLLEGWTKNIASGAMSIPPLLFMMIFLDVVYVSCKQVTANAITYVSKTLFEKEERIMAKLELQVS